MTSPHETDIERFCAKLVDEMSRRAVQLALAQSS